MVVAEGGDKTPVRGQFAALSTLSALLCNKSCFSYSSMDMYKFIIKIKKMILTFFQLSIPDNLTELLSVLGAKKRHKKKKLWKNGQ